MASFQKILEEYDAASGQKIKLLKSLVLFSPRMQVQLWLTIRDMLEIGEHCGTLQYLGVLIIRRRLSAWMSSE